MNIFAEAARLEADNRPFALAVILAARGSTPRNEGRMIIRSDGTTLGTVGGGPMELYVIEQAREALAEGRSRTVRRNLTSHGEEAAGMECGGTMEVHIDVVNPRPRLLLVGGGHVNQAVARAAALLEWDMAVVEDRPSFALPELFPAARRLHCVEDDLMAALDGAEIDGRTLVVIATKNDDLAALRRIVETPAAYIGMLGSKRKVALAMKSLRDDGVAEEKIRQVRSPVGLDIGAETPAEIAVSILGEMLKYLSGGSGRALRGFVQDLIVVRGAGDLATGCAWRLVRSGFRVVCLEISEPTVIRRSVSFAAALYEGTAEVEGVRAVRAEDVTAVYDILESGDVPVLADPEARSLESLKPAVLVDAVLAKRNIGTSRDMAPVTVALGPGFSAGDDVDAVVETARGHDLGRVILEGTAAANTGIPGVIGGRGAERVLRAPASGTFTPVAALGDLVEEGQLLARVGEAEIRSPFDGLVRGLLADGITVTEGYKIGDVDPRGADVDWRRISDKARAVAGGVLEAVLYLRARREGR